MAGEPWICPKCKTAWLVARGQCSNCGYGMPLPVVPEGANGALGQLFPKEVPWTPLEQQSQRPFDYQAALHEAQGQLVELGRRLDQAKQEHAHLLAGVQALLRPLQEWWQQRGVDVSLNDLVPQTVRALEQLARPAPPSPAAVTGASSDLLVEAMERLSRSLDGLQAKFSAPAVPYETWIQSDARIAALERGIQESNTARGEGFRG